ncbi:MAG: hypothetical protein WCJ71_10635 [Candidatus Omnitrophota bacterium]
MSTNEARSIHAADDWGVVIQSVPSKHKKDIVKHLERIFQLDRADAEQILSNVPLILMDNLSFWLAVRIKKFFQGLGAVVETTNHDVIKKNCLQVLWPQKPDLTFFMKNDEEPGEAPISEPRSTAKPMETPSIETKAASFEMKPEMKKIPEAQLLTKPVHESAGIFPSSPSAADEKPAGVSSAGVDLERRAQELNEKLRKIHEEKQALQARHAEEVEKVRKELQQQLETEKKKSSEMAKACEDLRREVPTHEASTREREEWRAKAVALEGKISEVEANLTQKTAALEHLIQQKGDLTRQFEMAAAETQRKLSTFQKREQDFLGKIEELERSVRQMTESLRFRDGVLAQFEKQISELSEMTFPKKTGPAE